MSSLFRKPDESDTPEASALRERQRADAKEVMVQVEVDRERHAAAVKKKPHQSLQLDPVLTYRSKNVIFFGNTYQKKTSMGFLDAH